jgi:hypothetical protein
MYAVHAIFGHVLSSLLRLKSLRDLRNLEATIAASIRVHTEEPNLLQR